MVESEINYANTKDKGFKALITAFNDIIDVDKDLVYSLLPDNGIVRPMTCFRSLLIIAGNSGITNTGLRAKIDYTKVWKSTNRLLELNYIDIVISPRYVPCFNKHKLTKGFVITSKGLKVLESLLIPSLAQTA